MMNMQNQTENVTLNGEQENQQINQHLKNIEQNTRQIVTNTRSSIPLITLIVSILGLILSIIFETASIGNHFINTNEVKEEQLLQEAKKQFDDGNYGEALSIYNAPELQNNDSAIINKGYIYAHGYGVEADFNEARKLYESVNSDDARRNRLALLIAFNSDGSYTDEINRDLRYFIDKKDSSVIDFVSYCLYGKEYASLTSEEQHFEMPFSDLRRYKSIKPVYYTTGNKAVNLGFKKIMFTGSVVAKGVKSGGILFAYDVCELQYIDLLEHI